MDIIQIDKYDPKILTVMVVHNRPELTDMCLRSYLNTVDKDRHFLVVVDNASDIETQKVLFNIGPKFYYYRSSENMYPGKACNEGFKIGLELYPEANLLQRTDNDIFFRYGWFKYIAMLFYLFPKLGEFGLLDNSEKYFFGTAPQVMYEKDSYRYNRLLEHDVGGSYVFRRELWDQGLRHIEDRWTHDEATVEDRQFRLDVENMGYHVGHSVEFLACHLGTRYGWTEDSPDYQYYKKTFEDRMPEKFEDFLQRVREA